MPDISFSDAPEFRLNRQRQLHRGVLLSSPESQGYLQEAQLGRWEKGALAPLPKGASQVEAICQRRKCGLDPWVRKMPWKRKWQPPPVFLPEECHGQRSAVGYSPWGCKEWDTAEPLRTAQEGPQAPLS